MPDPEKQPFNARMDALSKLVEELERGDLDLEDAIARFERGRRLHQELVSELDAYEKRLERLIADPDGEDRLEPQAEGDGES